MTAQRQPDQPDAPVDENQIIAERRGKLTRLRSGGVAFPNDFKPAHRAAPVRARTSSSNSPRSSTPGRRSAS